MGTCISKSRKTAILERTLSSAFNDFFRKHCEVGNGFHVLDMEMQGAINDYFDLVGLAEMQMNWSHENSALMFDHFGKEMIRIHGIHASGVRAHRIYLGVRVASWPHVKVIVH
jgi:hypothetical protein